MEFKLRLSKKALGWILVFLFELILVLCIEGLPGISGPSALEVSESDATLIRGAISLVIGEVKNGKILTTEEALRILKAELPRSVQETVIERVGTPSFDSLIASLTDVSENITIKQ